MSSQLAGLFTEFIGVENGDQVLDVGCGTGSLSFAIAENPQVAKVVGIDPSVDFVKYVRSQRVDARLDFEVADALNLPFAAASFDKTVALLVIGFFSDAIRAVREMRRVTKPGGIVAACWWDTSNKNEFHQCVWDAIVSLDPVVKRPAMAYSSENALSSLWHSVGLKNVEVSGLVLPYESVSFDHFWRYQYLQGQGGAAAYVVALPNDRREELKERFRKSVSGTDPDRPFTINANVWAVRGVVPLS